MLVRTLTAASTLAATITLTACGAAPDLDAERQAILEIDEQWAQAALDRDPAGFASVYAEGGRLMPPNAPSAVGPEAVEGMMTQVLSEGTTLEISPSEVHVARAGDLAYDIGTYEMTVETPDGTIEDEGKYLVVWEKVDGEWKVKADMFNSNLPLPGQ
ncbi:MAG: YybH family protein [Gemmatimonadota bacterium]